MIESDIRPQELFNRYLALAEADIDRFFRDLSQFHTTPCPACGEKRYHHEFVKNNFEYASCPTCQTLYLNPRPSQELVNQYYKESEAVRFWSEQFYPMTAEARRDKMFKPRAELAASWASKRGLNGTCLDIGPGYGLFLEEVNKLNIFKKTIGVEPGPHLASDCRNRGLVIIEKTIEQTTTSEVQADVAVNFEVLEHVYSPKQFLRSVRDLLTPKGILILTTLTASGFDIQELWNHSKSVHPPHHINLMSVAGMQTLFESSGFEILELTTPGQLDVSIVENTLKENPKLPLSRFTRSIITAEPNTKQDFQKFLSEHKMSSHICVIACNTQKQ